MRVWQSVKFLLRRTRYEAEMAEELSFHLEQRTHDLVRSGVPSAEATRQARLEFGCVEAYKEEIREERGWRFLDELGMDLRYALRCFRNHPAVAVVAILSFALGIGANTAIFSLTDALLLKRLPVPDPDQLVVMTDSQDRANRGYEPGEPTRYSYTDYLSLRHHNSVFSELAARTRVFAHPVEASGDVESASIEFVSGNYFSMLGVRAFLGRLLLPDDERHPGNMVAVLSHSFWQRRLGEDPGILGKTVRVNGHPFTIVGVSEPRFFGTEVGTAPDVRLPAPTVATIWQWNLNDPASEDWLVFGRLKPGIGVKQAQAATSALLVQIQGRTAPAQKWRTALAKQRYMSRGAVLQPASRGVSKLRNRFQKPLVVLMAVAAFILLIACANLTGLLVARAASRRREIALRVALGAGSWRVIQQFLVEALLLSLAGGAAGTLAAFPAARAILAGLPASNSIAPRLETSPDARVLSFTLFACVFTAVLCALAPTFHLLSTGLTAGIIRDRERALGRSTLPLWKPLVVVQVAVCLVLLTSAGLFLRSFRNVLNVDFGMERSHVLQLSLRTPNQRAYTGRWDQVLRNVVESVESMPGVRSAALARLGFVSGFPTKIFVGTHQPGGGAPVPALHNVVSAKYFSTLGIPFLHGAVWREGTKAGVAVVNQAFVRRYLPDREPLGQTLRFAAWDDLYRIVGVVKDTRYAELRENPQPTFYFPETGIHWQVYVRTAMPPGSIASAIRDRINSLDPNLAVSKVRTLDEETDASVAQDRLVSWVSGCFAAIGMLLVAVGLFGVVAYSVFQRTHEIGVRLALGASRPQVLSLVLAKTLTTVGLGIAGGLLAVMAFTRFIRSLLFGLDPSDPPTLVGACAVVAAVAVLAGFIRARRAVSNDPMAALRYD